MQIGVVIIRNSEGEFFVHQRKPDKKVFPNLYGLGAGGKIDEGEDFTDGAARELFEETGLRSNIKFLFDFKFKQGEIDYDLCVHECFTDENIKDDGNEWQWSGWMKKEEVDELLLENKLCPDTAIFYKRYISNFF